jgi:hypothetical protein
VDEHEIASCTAHFARPHTSYVQLASAVKLAFTVLLKPRRRESAGKAT